MGLQYLDGSRGENHIEQVHQAESAEYRRSVDAMIARHGAAPALTGKLTQEAHLYTYHVQNGAARGPGRAVIVHAVVVDIEKRGVLVVRCIWTTPALSRRRSAIS